MFRITLGRVFIQGLYILELLCAAFGRYGWPFLFACSGDTARYRG
jgi:hypothetical protein